MKDVKDVLVVHPKWASLILTGQKSKEVRTLPPPKKVVGHKIGIAVSGVPDLVVGTVQLVSWEQLSKEALLGMENETKVTESELNKYTKGDKNYAWKLEEPCIFERPVRLTSNGQGWKFPTISDNEAHLQHVAAVKEFIKTVNCRPQHTTPEDKERQARALITEFKELEKHQRENIALRIEKRKRLGITVPKNMGKRESSSKTNAMKRKRGSSQERPRNSTRKTLNSKGKPSSRERSSSRKRARSSSSRSNAAPNPIES